MNNQWVHLLAAGFRGEPSPTANFVVGIFVGVFCLVGFFVLKDFPEDEIAPLIQSKAYKKAVRAYLRGCCLFFGILVPLLALLKFLGRS